MSAAVRPSDEYDCKHDRGKLALNCVVLSNADSFASAQTGIVTDCKESQYRNAYSMINGRLSANVTEVKALQYANAYGDMVCKLPVNATEVKADSRNAECPMDIELPGNVTEVKADSRNAE